MQLKPKFWMRSTSSNTRFKHDLQFLSQTAYNTCSFVGADLIWISRHRWPTNSALYPINIHGQGCTVFTRLSPTQSLNTVVLTWLFRDHHTATSCRLPYFILSRKKLIWPDPTLINITQVHSISNQDYSTSKMFNTPRWKPVGSICTGFLQYVTVVTTI